MKRQVPDGYFSTYTAEGKNKRRENREEFEKKRNDKLEELSIKRTDNGLVCTTCNTLLNEINTDETYAMECPNCEGEWYEED